MLLQPVIGHDFQCIELEGADGLAFEIFGLGDAGLGDNADAAYSTTADDLDVDARIVEREERGVGHDADIDLPGRDHGDFVGKGRRGDQLEVDALLSDCVEHVRQEEVEVAEAGAVGCRE